jgi:hypothetical protein
MTVCDQHTWSDNATQKHVSSFDIFWLLMNHCNIGCYCLPRWSLSCQQLYPALLPLDGTCALCSILRSESCWGGKHLWVVCMQCSAWVPFNGRRAGYRCWLVLLHIAQQYDPILEWFMSKWRQANEWQKQT